jgi:hypothetical protein
MVKYPDTIVIEYYNGTAWADISAYVVSSLIGEQGLDDILESRVGFLGSLQLELNNVGGLFMPMGGDAVKGLPTLTGFNKGAKIRVRATLGDYNKVLWTGRIDSLNADDGIWEEQRVKLFAVDWFDVATRFPMKGSDILLDKNLSEAMTALLARITIQPEATDIDTGTNTFPAVFEDVKDKTKAIAEINKLALSELGYIYLLKDGTLRVEDSSARKGTRELDKVPVHPDLLTNLLLIDGDDFLLIDGDTLILDEAEEAQLALDMEKLEIILKNDVVNRADVRAYPVRTATALEVVFSLGSPMLVPAGQSITFKAHYKSPDSGQTISATNLQTPVATTDYLMNSAEDGSGSNLTASFTVTATYYGDLVEYLIENEATDDGYITHLQARGYGVYYDTPVTGSYEDADSIEAQGETIFEIDQKYKRNLWDALAYGRSTVEEYKTPKLRVSTARYNANLNASHLMAFLFLDVGSLIEIHENKSGITKHYYILSRKFTIDVEKNISVTYGLRENLSYLSDTLVPIELNFGYIPYNRVNFGHLPKTAGLTRRSVSAWVYPRQVDARIISTITDNSRSGFMFTLGGTNQLQVYQKDYPDLGIWNTDNNSVTASGWHHVAFTRDRSEDTSADPIIYIDGAAVNITEAATPSTGIITDEEGLDLKLRMTDGILSDVRMYDDILTSGEVHELYSNDPYADVVMDNLVFQAPFLNADLGNVDDFTGDIPDGANVFDNIYKAVGIPFGTPFNLREFELHTTPSNAYFSVAYSSTLNLFVAVGDSAGTTTHIMTSPDGVTWTARTSPNESYFEVCWASGLSLFVAVGTNCVATSPDGITWTSRTPAAANDWRGVVWASGLNLLVCVGRSGTGNRVMTSPNGINWTARTSAADNDWRNIAYSAELGLLVATSFDGSANRVMTSSNGTSWTSRTTTDREWSGVVWSKRDAQFVAVASNYSMVSTDGITWTETNHGLANGWRGLAYSTTLGVYMAVADTGTNRVMYSTDGTDWASLTPAADNSWWGICWASDFQIFVIVGYSGTERVMTF